MDDIPVRLLEGFLALDLTDLKGQFCGKLLADLGMQVIKVEPPTGDPVRGLGPFAHDEPGLESSLRFAYLNAGKQSLTLDLGRPEGRDLLLRLVEHADVVLESGQPGDLDRLGLGTAALLERNPRLVLTSVSGFGQTGPRRDYLVSDIVGLAMGGLLYISGDPALPPVKAPETQAFYFASVYAALGTVLALWQRDAATHAPRQHVDISIQEAIASQEQLINKFASDGQSITRHGSQHEHVAPATIFPARDGYVYLFVARPHWRQFLAAWPDHPTDLDEPRWEHNHVRRAEAERINDLVGQFTRRFAKDEFATLMQKHGIPCLPVNSPVEFVADEQVRDRELFAASQHPVLGAYRQVAFPLLMDGERAPVAPPPLLGEHTEQLLRERLGLSVSTLAQLVATGVC